MAGTTDFNLCNPWQLCGYNPIVGLIRNCCALPSKQKVQKAITQSNRAESLAAARNRAAVNSTVSVSRRGSCAWIATATIAWTISRTWRSVAGQYGLLSTETNHQWPSPTHKAVQLQTKRLSEKLRMFHREDELFNSNAPYYRISVGAYRALSLKWTE